MARERQPLERGTLLDTYRIEGLIGGGGFSLVYNAVNETNNKAVVIKEYYPKDIAHRRQSGRVEPKDEKALPPFQFGMRQYFNEASALSKVKHPNIVNITNIFRAFNTVYIVMDYEMGRDLKWFIKRCAGSLDESFIHSVFPPIIDGVIELHKRDFLHLDIKPANILLRKSGSPLLLDFGAAQRAETGDRFSSFQTLTHGFAPPEQYLEGKLGAWSDVYALGSTLYSCVTGKSPPPALRRRNKDPLTTFVEQYRLRFSTRLLTTIMQALELDPKARPQTVDAFSKAAFDGVVAAAASNS